MNKRAIVLFALLPCAIGCASAPAPTAKAAEVERLQCDAETTSPDDVRILETASVLGVTPLYSHVITGNNGVEERVDGVKMMIRPPQGVTADRMTRILQCHSARALLGQVDRSAFPDDPFWVPGQWISVEVKPENGNYAVTLEANDIPTNLRLAAQAKAYAQSHPMQSSDLRP